MRRKSTQSIAFLWAIFIALAFVMTGCSRDNDTTAGVTLLQTTDLHNAASGVGSFNAYTPMNTA
ncbi:MAG: hypothetical protein JW943_10545, partial [Deltaproteobacteria bacterium]|nr:hypothetical protein [Deltaproteobacteria bacterium]